MINKILVIGMMLVGSSGWCSDDFQLPSDELAKESVLPKFDFPDTVRNRNVITAKKFEFGVLYGLNFTEPIYNQTNYDLSVGYAWNDYSALVAHYLIWGSGRNSQYAKSLYDQFQLDFGRAPDKQSSLYLNYERRAYYGKISLTKNTSMNLSFFWLAGAGMTKYSHKSFPALNGGVGWKFYLTKAIALRTDLQLWYAQGPSPFLRDRIRADHQVPTPSEFSEKWDLGFNFDLGLSFLF